MRGLCTEANLRFKIDWASLIFGKEFTVILCFTLCSRTISKYKPPGEGGGGAYLYLVGLIHRGAYFRNLLRFLFEGGAY